VEILPVSTVTILINIENVKSVIEKGKEREREKKKKGRKRCARARGLLFYKTARLMNHDT